MESLSTSEIMTVSFLSLFLMILMVGYQVVVFVQCWKNQDISRGAKIGWSVFMVFSLFFYGIAAIVYGLIYYKKYYKLIPVAIVVLGAIIFAYMVQYGLDVTRKVSVGIIHENVVDPNRKAELLDNFDTLKNESSFAEDAGAKVVLAHYLTVLVLDGLTDAEYNEWKWLFENRNNLADEEIEKIGFKLRKEALENEERINGEVE